MATLAENRYGKSRVRVMKVVRHETHHAMKEWSVRVLLHGDFESCFTAGDNSKILPTDTMKNTVYYLARESNASTLEAFAIELVEYLLANNPQVTKASAEIEEKSWKQMLIDGTPHPTTYQLNGPELQTAVASLERGNSVLISSGVDGLVILKTTKSAFTGYIKDKLTTLPESTDRIFGTRATAVWGYAAPPQDYEATRATALATLLKVFAEHDSLSVQHTLFDIGQAMLEAVPTMARVKLTMPNLHSNLVDLSRFGQTNPNQIFVPIDEPHGYIEAVIER
ncbi:MAG TPA: urate oxidase [Acidobacteriaceae bacterium]|jgi:urate oxidase|nr:urate oxidase [Acidobacteriaceae bacterium]